MKRGEIWTASGGDYAGKPRPVFIVQADAFPFLNSVTICPFTSDGQGLDIFRVAVKPGEQNGLSVLSFVMKDKITTLPMSKLGKRIGMLGMPDITRVERAVMVFLGLG